MFVDAGLSPVEIAIALTAWSATTFFLQIPAGVIADRFSRRHVLAIAQAGRAAGFALWLIWPHFWGFFAGQVLWGCKSAFTSGTFEALLYDELKARGREDRYTRMIGRAQAVQALGVLCASVGAAAMARLGYPAALLREPRGDGSVQHRRPVAATRRPRAAGSCPKLPRPIAPRPGDHAQSPRGAAHPWLLRTDRRARRRAGGVLADFRGQGRPDPRRGRPVRRRAVRGRGGRQPAGAPARASARPGSSTRSSLWLAPRCWRPA